MFCSKCGKKLADDAKFCDGCGAKVGNDQPVAEKKDVSVKEGKIFKCPYCGEILPYDAVRCPSCGKEIRGREVNSTVQALLEKISEINDDDKKIELITTFPIPNSREDIFELMFLASSNFDAKYYATNKEKDSVASAWLSKFDQCYQKAQFLFTDQGDIARVEKLFNKVHGETKKASSLKLWLILGGVIGILGGLVIICTIGQSNTAVSGVGIVLLAAGIIALILGFKRKKTNKEISEEKAQKYEWELAKAKKKSLKKK